MIWAKEETLTRQEIEEIQFTRLKKPKAYIREGSGISEENG